MKKSSGKGWLRMAAAGGLAVSLFLGMGNNFFLNTARTQELSAEQTISAARTASALQAVSAAQDLTVGQTQRLNVWYSQAIESINAGDYENALLCLDSCFFYVSEESNPELCADLYMKKGYCYVMTGEDEDALEVLDQALAIDGELSQAWLLKMIAYNDLAQFDQAIDAMTTYIAISGDTSMYETLAQLYEANGQPDEAFESYKIFADSNSEDDASARFALGIYQRDRGYFDRALETFLSLTEDEEIGVEAAYQAGLCQLNLGSYEEAAALFDQCIEKEAQIDGLYYYRGLCAMSGADYEKAVEFFARSAESESFAGAAVYNKATCEMSLLKYEDAVADFQACIELDEGNEEAPIDLGICYMLMGQNEEAVRVFTETIEKKEAALTVQEGGTEEGMEPATISGENEGEVLPEPDGTEGEETKQSASGSTEADSRVEEARYFRSVVYLSMEEYELALEDLTKCIENEYDLPLSYQQRAQVYKAMGDEDAYKADLAAAKESREKKENEEAVSESSDEEIGTEPEETSDEETGTEPGEEKTEQELP